MFILNTIDARKKYKKITIPDSSLFGISQSNLLLFHELFLELNFDEYNCIIDGYTPTNYYTVSITQANDNNESSAIFSYVDTQDKNHKLQIFTPIIDFGLLGQYGNINYCINVIKESITNEDLAMPLSHGIWQNTEEGILHVGLLYICKTNLVPYIYLTKKTNNDTIPWNTYIISSFFKKKINHMQNIKKNNTKYILPMKIIK